MIGYYALEEDSGGLFSKYQTLLDYATANTITNPAEAENLINSNFFSAIDPICDFDFLYKLNTNSNSAFSLLNWSDPGTFDASDISSPNFTLKAGWTSAGSGSYLDTNFTPSTDGTNFTLTDCSYGIYLNSISDGDWAMGSRGGGQDQMFRTTGLARLNSLSSTTFANVGTGEGLLVVTRTGTTVKVFWNGSQVGTSTNTATSLSAYKNFIMAANESGSAGGVNSSDFYGAFAGEYIPDANQSAFYTAWQTAINATKAL